MLEFINAGGWIMWPLILCSILATAITIERFWFLRKKNIVPKNLVPQVWKWVKSNKLDKQKITILHNHSPLGRILAAGLSNRNHSRAMMKISIEEASGQVVHS
ncbi:MAG TPA: MotA/TolQ/ExbB proton channel family protein, partial [Thioploca sp.]|nr:MotA/TolQ/ExbB proton channel family protein [Thioploca sp.]